VRILILILFLLIVILQYRLWVGEGSLAEVSTLQQQVEEQKTQNASLRDRNAALDAEVTDLKTGFEAIEERARSELGMIREDETFYQVVEREEGKE
jgi:cell division protein FtsB